MPEAKTVRPKIEAGHRTGKLTEDASVTIRKSLPKRIRAINCSGHTGLYRNQRTGKWEAQITFRNRCYRILEENAVKARQRGEEMHTDFPKRHYRCGQAQPKENKLL